VGFIFLQFYPRKQIFKIHSGVLLFCFSTGFIKYINQKCLFYRIEQVRIQVSNSNITFGMADRLSIHCLPHIIMASSILQFYKHYFFLTHRGSNSGPCAYYSTICATPEALCASVIVEIDPCVSFGASLDHYLLIHASCIAGMTDVYHHVQVFYWLRWGSHEFFFWAGIKQ
jgi:hypothetical protein